MLKFYPMVEQTLTLEKIGLYKCFAFLLVFNQIIMCALLTTPYYIRGYYSGYILLGLQAYFIVFETLLLLIGKVKFELAIFNPYLLLSTFGGFVNKAAILCLGQMGGIVTDTNLKSGFILGAFALFSIFVD